MGRFGIGAGDRAFHVALRDWLHPRCKHRRLIDGCRRLATDSDPALVWLFGYHVGDRFSDRRGGICRWSLRIERRRELDWRNYFAATAFGYGYGLHRNDRRAHKELP